MKWFLQRLLVLLVPVISFGQPPIDVPKKEPCYKKAQERKGQRFTEWECGKIAGVVDCNEKLELDPATGTVLSSGSKKPFTGTCETCHMNGLLERRVTFVNGRANGVDTTTYPSGCPMVVRNHIQGVENGTWTYYFDSLGTVSWEENYAVGQKNGPQITYAKNGDTVKLETYASGVLNGPKILYHPNGMRRKVSVYVNGLLEGKFLVYNTDGKIIEELTYKEGKRNGILKYYYDDGTLLRTESWSMDVKNGEFKTLYYQGFIQATENYRKGLKEGWFEEFYPNQKPKRRVLYKKDVRVEEHVFDEQGRETYTFGVAPPTAGNEDDEMPVNNSKKKKKKEKKPKKSKKNSSGTEGEAPQGN